MCTGDLALRGPLGNQKTMREYLGMRLLGCQPNVHNSVKIAPFCFNNLDQISPLFVP